MSSRPGGARPGPPDQAAGYSATPLARKLGLKPRQVLSLHGAPSGWMVPDLPEGTTLAGPGAKADVSIAFFREAAELRDQARQLAREVWPQGALWVAWPRRAAGRTSDLTDNFVREVLLPLGLVDVKVAALGGDWSGLKFVWRKELRTRQVPGPALYGPQ